ncbi:conserved hypothetical protein [Agrobacterium fabacearum S56]|nr:conserved hypothetical protein [Agrobacterium fabacearum S56]
MLSLCLEKEPAFANTRQRPGLSFHRSLFAATVRLCSRKIALPSYQFGLNISAPLPPIYMSEGGRMEICSRFRRK